MGAGIGCGLWVAAAMTARKEGPSLSRMPWTLYGIDEAGYGPRLGPLVQACVRLPQAEDARQQGSNGTGEGDTVDFEDWEAVSTAVSAVGETLRQAADQAGIAVGDSKALYAAARRGERTKPAAAAAMVATAGSVAGATRLWQSVMALGGGSDGAVAPTGWPAWVRVDLEQHPVEEHPSAGLDPAALAAGKADRAGGVATGAPGRLDLHAICLYPRQFNDWATGKNKAEINWELTRRLVRARLAAAAAVEPATGGRAARMVWTLDRQGGRKKYGGLLGELFAPAYVQIVMETSPLSVYRIRSAAVDGWVAVKVGGEAWSVGTALASMAAKALREAAMARLNGYFCGRHPSLRPTAGYPVDADRWRAAVEELGGADGGGTPWEQVWRCK